MQEPTDDDTVKGGPGNDKRVFVAKLVTDTDFIGVCGCASYHGFSG